MIRKLENITFHGIYAIKKNVPIVTTDQTPDLKAMMVSLMWNMQAWRDWLQANMLNALAPIAKDDQSEEAAKEWNAYKKRVFTEAMQWRQYNKFSQRLTARLALRYKDKEIVSPTRATVLTKLYTEYQEEMSEIIKMLNKWTQWLVIVLKQTETLQQEPGLNTGTHNICKHHFRRKVEERLADWIRYNMHLKISWEHKYKELIQSWLPMIPTNPVWVVGACGAVPSGAVVAGIYNGETTYLARTTYQCEVLPATLLPSKHSCMVYADGGVHYCTKYQVMCNADASWISGRARMGVTANEGGMHKNAVQVAPNVFVGRVFYHGSHLIGPVLPPYYRCHVVIYNRPFAFNCYEQLVLESCID